MLLLVKKLCERLFVAILFSSAQSSLDVNKGLAIATLFPPRPPGGLCSVPKVAYCGSVCVFCLMELMLYPEKTFMPVRLFTLVLHA